MLLIMKLARWQNSWARTLSRRSEEKALRLDMQERRWDCTRVPRLTFIVDDFLRELNGGVVMIGG